MSSLIFQKRERFTVNLRKNQKEEIFKKNRRPIISQQSLLELMQNYDDESIDYLIDVSSGSKEMTLLMIDLGGIQYFYDVLQQGKIDEGILGLGNLCSDRKAQEEIQNMDVIDFMLEEVHKYENIDQLTKRLWFLSVLAKRKCEPLDYDVQELREKKMFQIFLKYQEKYPDIQKIQQECFYGFYFLVKRSSIQFDLIQICCDNLNKGLDNIIVRIMYNLIHDNYKLIYAIHKSQFISQCHTFLQINDRQRHTLGILSFYAQYYPKNIIEDDQLVEQIKLLVTTDKNKKHVLQLLFILLLRSPTALLMRIVEKFEIIDYLKNELTLPNFDEQNLFIIASLKQQNEGIIQELIPYLEKIALDKNTTKILLKKIQKLID